MRILPKPVHLQLVQELHLDDDVPLMAYFRMSRESAVDRQVQCHINDHQLGPAERQKYISGFVDIELNHQLYVAML